MKFKNNPANIRYSSKNPWRGQIDSKDGFCQFSSLEFGVRALLILIAGYRTKGFDTIDSIISRYAPSFENNTGAYVGYCASVVGKPSFVHLTSYDIPYLVKAILWYESNTNLSIDSILRYCQKYL